MMSVRCAHSCIAYHGYLYAIGGYNNIYCLCSGEKYNPTTNEWMQIPDMSWPRAAFGIAVIDDTIFAMCGTNGNQVHNQTNTVECYDAKSNAWIAARDMDVSTSSMSACVVKGLPNACDYIKYNKDGSVREEVAGVVDSVD
jgi:kelch-like protein 10